MLQKFKLLALSAGLAFMAPTSSALDEASFEVKFNYDPVAPVEITYRNAVRTAYRACRMGSHLLPVKQALKRTCMQPVIEDFVIATGNQDLIALHETKTGRTIGETKLAAN